MLENNSLLLFVILACALKNLVSLRHKKILLFLMACVGWYVQGPPNTFFFLENALKKTTEYFLKFLFIFESTILPINNEK